MQTDAMDRTATAMQASCARRRAEPERFMERGLSGEALATIAALRGYAAEICDAEVARALARLEDMSGCDAPVVRALAERIVGRLLAGPIAMLESETEEVSAARVLGQLFQLGPRASG